jgi:putative monooxygenase
MLVPERTRSESIHPGWGEFATMGPGLELREFVSQACGAEGFSTGIATFRPGAALAYHRHRFSEAITILAGEATVAAEGRVYRLPSLDCIHLPSGVAHKISNTSPDTLMVAHWTFACATPSCEFVKDTFTVQECGLEFAHPTEPEHVARFSATPVYELATDANFRDLFGSKCGAVGICGGYGRFQPGASLPCHMHSFDESITIIEGEAACQIQGRLYRLSRYDTAFVPARRPHRFLNLSDAPMAMIWVYAGGEPERTIVDSACCSGS